MQGMDTRVVAIGNQNFEDMISHNNFYIDKTHFIKEWWENRDSVTLITRPRRFGKTLLMSMVEQFFSVQYKEKFYLFEGLDIFKEEAYLHGYWENMVAFIRTFFNTAFKTNPYMERALLTGITRISKESIFSDLNNLTIVTTTSRMYADSFGFTEKEVFESMDAMGMGDEKKEVKQWYNGFTFGNQRDIYNPWSILNFFKFREFSTYWANTSFNSLLSRLLQSASKEIKQKLEVLLDGKTITETLDEQIVFNQLNRKKGSVWSLMLASGYLKVEYRDIKKSSYTLSLTNYEVTLMMKGIIMDWFQESDQYNEFLNALLACDTKAMNVYLNRVLVQIVSFFDGGRNPSGTEPERFYHGLVLGLIAELEDRYVIRSNRESGFGRYDVMMEPMDKNDPAYILEFKVFDPDEEGTLEDTAKAGLAQIKEKRYREDLLARGFQEGQIQCCAFAFEGKKVLIKTE